MAIQMNVSGLRRNLKNIAHNYTDAQVKVREATSNDPWGPSSTLMSEIADLTYNVVAFSEIMQMIWKRLNDHGRNWRHVYKALVLLEYLIKTGSEKIADQCKENIFAIQTLKDFQYLEENKDMGMNVREKAKILVSLLKDDEKLRNERVKALKAKERFAQSVSGIGSDSKKRSSYYAEELTIECDGDKDINSPSSPSYPDTFVTSTSRQSRDAFGVTDHHIAPSDLENARPQTIGEEELQLQLALAMSKEEADQEEAKRKSDDVRLQMALSQSEVDYSSPEFGCATAQEYRDKHREKEKSALKDLLDINFNPNGIAASSSMSALQSNNSNAPIDPWGVPVGGSAMSSGSMSPQNVTTAVVQQKTTLLDIFQDYDDLNVPTSSSSANNLHCLDSLADPWGLPVVNRDTCTPKQNDPWSSPASAPSSRVTSPPTTNDPWAPKPRSPEPPVQEDDPWLPKPSHDPWNPVSSTPAPHEVDPFAPIASPQTDEFSAISTRERSLANSDDAFNLDCLRDDLPSQNGLHKGKSPTTFLGENSNLVNLDNLVSVRPNPVGMGGTTSPSYQNMSSLHTNSQLNGFNFASDFDYRINKETTTNNNINMNNNNNNNNNNNPFLSLSTNPAAALASSFVPGVNPFSSGPSPPNPFQAQQVPKPSLNEMRTQGSSSPANLSSPWGPTPNNLDRENASPFML